MYNVLNSRSQTPDSDARTVARSKEDSTHVSTEWEQVGFRLDLKRSKVWSDLMDTGKSFHTKGAE